MGTSNPYPGPTNNTPLIPDWLDPGGPPVPEMPGDLPQPAPIPPSDDPQLVPQSPFGNTPPETITLPLPNRFTTARTYLSRFSSSGGIDRYSFGRGISSYITKSSGGSRQAARRMGSSRKVGQKLLGFLQDTIERGVKEALNALQLDSLAGLPIDEIFLGMMDYICPDGGNVDEGIARDAFIETIADLAENGISDLNSLSPSQMQTFFELYTSHSIESRLFNDVGTKNFQFPTDALTALQIQVQIQEFIRRGVSDAIISTKDKLLPLTQSNIQGFVDQIYYLAFELLRNMGSMEAGE